MSTRGHVADKTRPPCLLAALRRVAMRFRWLTTFPAQCGHHVPLRTKSYVALHRWRFPHSQRQYVLAVRNRFDNTAPPLDRARAITASSDGDGRGIRASYATPRLRIDLMMIPAGRRVGPADRTPAIRRRGVMKTVMETSSISTALGKREGPVTRPEGVARLEIPCSIHLSYGREGGRASPPRTTACPMLSIPCMPGQGVQCRASSGPPARALSGGASA